MASVKMRQTFLCVISLPSLFKLLSLLWSNKNHHNNNYYDSSFVCSRFLFAPNKWIIFFFLFRISLKYSLMKYTPLVPDSRTTNSSCSITLYFVFRLILLLLLSLHCTLAVVMMHECLLIKKKKPWTKHDRERHPRKFDVDVR